MFVYNRALSIYEIVHNIQHLQISTSQIDQLQKQGLIKQIQHQIIRKNQQLQYLHSMIINQIHEIKSKITKLTHIQIYAYKNLNTTWVQSNGQKTTIYVANFIINFLLHIQKVSSIGIQIIKILKSTNNLTNETILQMQLSLMRMHVDILNKNFPTLYNLNIQLPYFYQNLFINTISNITLLGYCKLGISIVIIISILLVFYYSWSYRIRQIQGINTIFSRIQINIVQTLFNYYSVLQRSLDNIVSTFTAKTKKQQVIKTSQSLKPQIVKLSAKNSTGMNKLYQQTLYTLHNPSQNQYNTHKINFLSINNTFNSILFKLLLPIIFITICTVNILMFQAEKNILNTTNIMMNGFNNMINSQNHIFGSYFQMKGSYILNTQNSNTNQEQFKAIITKFLHIIDVQQIQFNKYAIKMLRVFQNYDPDYTQNLIKILIGNICQLIHENISDNNYNQCIKDEKINFAKNGGTIISTNFFSRTIQQAYLAFLSQNNINFQVTFSYPTIDKIIFRMFKIYQSIQSQTTKSLKFAINKQNIYYLLLISIQIVILCGIFGYLIIFYRRQNKESIDRVGRILLLPITVMKNNSTIMKIFQKVSDINNLRF